MKERLLDLIVGPECKQDFQMQDPIVRLVI